MRKVEELVKELDEQTVIEFLKDCDQKYFNSEEETDISDAEYENVRFFAEEQWPNNPYFQTIGAPDIYGEDIELPVPLGSLDQKYDDNDIQNWIKRYNLQDKKLIITEKLDGSSCLLVYKFGKLISAFSRGDGIFGKSILHNVLHIDSIPKFISNNDLLYIRGEIILDPIIFEEKYSNQYKNPRNFVGGKMNKKDPEKETLKDFSFIAHEYANNTLLTKEESLLFLKLFFVIPQYLIIDASFTKELNVLNLIKIIEKFRSNGKYEIDGIVITANFLSEIENISRSSSLNPEHSIKFKSEDLGIATEVTNILWELSKHGVLKPRIEFIPIDIDGTTVTYCSGYNARYIYDNKLSPGCKIRVYKAGKIIPKIKEILKHMYID